MGRHRSVESLVDEQARRLDLRRVRPPKTLPGRSVVTISRQPGARGGEVARRLCQEMGYDLFDREILHQVSQSSQLSERVVGRLDDKDRSLLSDWLTTFAGSRSLSPYGYIEHLTRVVRAIARQGSAVILGRGAHAILGPSVALRVLIVAPLEQRVSAVVCREGITSRNARYRIALEEGERRAFLRRHFHEELWDPVRFDLVLNTGSLGVEGAVRAIRAALPTALAAKHDVA